LILVTVIIIVTGNTRVERVDTILKTEKLMKHVSRKTN